MMSDAAAEPADKIVESSEAAKAEAGGFALWKLSLFLVIGLLVLDHATKIWAIHSLKPDWWDMTLTAEILRDVWPKRPVIVVIPGFLHFEYAENTGAAFSMLSEKTFLLGFVSLAATIALFFFWKSLPAAEAWGRAGVAMILSGAIGNMIDRFMRGYVVDFIHAFWRDYHWPIFNIADSAICIGAGILAIRFLKGKI